MHMNTFNKLEKFCPKEYLKLYIWNYIRAGVVAQCILAFVVKTNHLDSNLGTHKEGTGYCKLPIDYHTCSCDMCSPLSWINNCNFKRYFRDDPSGKCFTQKHEYLSSDPNTHVKLGMATCAHNHGAGDVEIGESIDLMPSHLAELMICRFNVLKIIVGSNWGW